jgi:transaldolase
VGVDLPAVFAFLEDDGVKKFAAAWQDLIDHVEAALNK